MVALDHIARPHTLDTQQTTSLSVGDEFQNEVLDRVHKSADLTGVREKVDCFHRHGIRVIGNFMLGFPDETQEQMEQTLALALSLDLAAANFSIYVPMPGTRLYEQLRESGKLEKNSRFQDYNYVAYRNNFSRLSPHELLRFRNKCMLRFYLRWKIVSMLWDVLQQGILWNSLLRRIYYMYIKKFFKSKQAL